MITNFLYLIPPILFALTIHEFSHGYVADRLGDPTPRLNGRLTLNPLSHLDPIGTLMLFLVHFGWAKPVPVDPRNLANPKNDMLWIALAGPLSNMLAALGFGLIIRTLNLSPIRGAGIIEFMLIYSVIINIGLAIFNLIPIPPLDGSKILMSILPPELAYKYARVERYGGMILLGLILFGQFFRISIIGMFLSPIINTFFSLFTGFSM